MVNDNINVYRNILNYLYLALSKTAGTIPFNGRYWLEEITRSVGEQVLDKYVENLAPESRRPVDICRTYLGVLDQEGFLQVDAYRLQAKGDSVLVTLSRKQCVYQDYCQGTEKDGLFFSCPRLGSLQAALKRGLGVEYATSVEIDGDTDMCHGRISPVKHGLKTETVTRRDDVLESAGKRAILLNQEMYASILTAIKRYAPHVLEKVLYDAGYSSSLPIAKYTKDYYNSPAETLAACFEELKNAGLGKIDLIFLDPESGRAVIRCDHSFEVAVIQKDLELYRTPRVICDLLRGKLSAYLSIILERPILCEEMKCASMGGAYCEFHAYPEQQTEQDGKE